MITKVLAVDPGTAKCGLAIVSRGPVVEHRGIVAKSEVAAAVRDLAERFNPERILIGGGTGAAEIGRLLKNAELGLEVETVDERFSSELARARYFQENPPRGWRRLIPVTMQTPPRPIDDYAAVLLAERYLGEVDG